MQPYTPHGDSNQLVADVNVVHSKMQPYTPHGDSNGALGGLLGPLDCGCNLIPLTGTVTLYV